MASDAAFTGVVKRNDPGLPIILGHTVIVIREFRKEESYKSEDESDFRGDQIHQRWFIREIYDLDMEEAARRSNEDGRVVGRWKLWATAKGFEPIEFPHGANSRSEYSD